MKLKKGIFPKTRRGILFVLCVGVMSAGCVKVQTFVPQCGQPGSEIEIIGSGFSTNLSDNKVSFGEVLARVDSASTETLWVKVPEGISRAKIKVSRGWRFSGKSKTDFIPLSDSTIRYRRFESATLGIRQGYWIMYPPSFSIEGKRFPIIYALHGYCLRNPISAKVGEKLKKIWGLADPGGRAEHGWVLGVKQPGHYFPFIAQSMMKSSSVAELRALLEMQLAAIASEIDLENLLEVVESILYYLPPDPDSWLPHLEEMVIVMPDGDNSFYTDRLGPPEDRNEDGLGAEPSFPTPSSKNPAGRFDLHVTGWYERYIMQDLIERVEMEDIGVAKLVEEDKRRFIMGISMGGFGSLKLALKHQDKFIAVASLSGVLGMNSADIQIYNKYLPELIDVFGSAPLRFDATPEELQTNIQVDEAYIAGNNPMNLVESLDEINLDFFVEIGENDEKLFIPIGAVGAIGSLRAHQNFIAALKDKGVPVVGGVVPAASGDEPDNGDAMHVQAFFRSRFGAVLKFFSDVYKAR